MENNGRSVASEVNALKEWAVVVRALTEGKQLVTLRKGGIREPGKHFRLEGSRFFLYPTFDHQQLDLVRSEFHDELQRALEYGVWSDSTPPPTAITKDGGIPQPQAVSIRAWAEIACSYELTDTTAVDAVAPYHIWSNDYAEKRLKWKPRHPLHVMLLRVYRLAQQMTITTRPEYAGCRSWIKIDDVANFEGTPVLSDQEFTERAVSVRKSLVDTSGAVLSSTG